MRAEGEPRREGSRSRQEDRRRPDAASTSMSHAMRGNYLLLRWQARKVVFDLGRKVEGLLDLRRRHRRTACRFEPLSPMKRI